MSVLVNTMSKRSFDFRFSSFINIFGLAVGMAACLLIVQYVRYEWSYENFHKNASNITRITLDLYKGSEFVITDAETYRPDHNFKKV